MKAALFLLAVAGLVAAADETPPYKVTTKKADDKVEFKAEKDRVLFAVTSPSGIGQATVERTGEKWPAAVVLHLRLKGLESFKAGNDKMTLNASVGREKTRVWKDDQENPGLDEKSPLWLKMRLTDDAYEVVLPPAFFESNPKTISLGWIDFYRD